MFRDESGKTAQKAHKPLQDDQFSQTMPIRIRHSPPSQMQSSASLFSSPGRPPTPYSRLSIPLADVGANFFFSTYQLYEPPFSSGYYAWMAKVYNGDQFNPAVRAAVDAAGMAGLANVLHAPQVAAKSREQYAKALFATQQAMSDPVEVTADETLLAVILLGMFETITFENWSQSRSWSAHVEGAATLLDLRGQGQFHRERGAQLFLLLRSQLLHVYMHQGAVASPAMSSLMLLLSRTFTPNRIEAFRYRFRRGTLADLSYRLVELRSAMNNGDVTDPKDIREKAISIDWDLDAWSSNAPPDRMYATVEASPPSPELHFKGKSQVYESFCHAQVWNNYRTLRILANQLVLQNEVQSVDPDAELYSAALSRIRQMSTETCISTSQFMGSPRKNSTLIVSSLSLISSTGAMSLIWPLYVVSQEELNGRSEREWALEHLRRINESMGIRQAGVFADAAAQSLKNDLPSRFVLTTRRSESQPIPKA